MPRAAEAGNPHSGLHTWMCQGAHAHTCAHFWDMSVRSHGTQQLAPHCTTQKYIKNRKNPNKPTKHQPTKERASCSIISMFCPVMDRKKEESCSSRTASSGPSSLKQPKLPWPAASLLALTSEGPGAPHSPKLAALTPLLAQTSSCSLFGQTNPRMVLLSCQTWIISLTFVQAADTLCGSGVRSPLAQKPQRRLEGIC